MFNEVLLDGRTFHRTITITAYHSCTHTQVIYNYQKDKQTTDNLNYSCSFTVKLKVVVMKCLKNKKKTRVILITVARRWFFLLFKYSFTHNSLYMHAGMNKESMWSFSVWRTVLIIQLIKLVTWWSSRNKPMDSNASDKYKFSEWPLFNLWQDQPVLTKLHVLSSTHQPSSPYMDSYTWTTGGTDRNHSITHLVVTHSIKIFLP
jgi:hypothetical protein